MHDSLIKYINSFASAPLSESEINLIKDVFVPKKIRKKQYMLQEGEVCKYTAFIVKGAMRQYSVDEPRVLYISYGETDEWAHSGHYKDYLNSAHQIDKWLNDIWNFVQNDSHYKNKTALFITVDHGRGDVVKEKWTSHNNKIEDSHQIWFAIIGPGIPAKGEVKASMKLWQKQYAATFAELLGLKFICEHPVAEGLKEILVK